MSVDTSFDEEGLLWVLVPRPFLPFLLSSSFLLSLSLLVGDVPRWSSSVIGRDDLSLLLLLPTTFLSPFISPGSAAYILIKNHACTKVCSSRHLARHPPIDRPRSSHEAGSTCSVWLFLDNTFTFVLFVWPGVYEYPSAQAASWIFKNCFQSKFIWLLDNLPAQCQTKTRERR